MDRLRHSKGLTSNQIDHLSFITFVFPSLDKLLVFMKLVKTLHDLLSLSEITFCQACQSVRRVFVNTEISQPI